MSNDNLEFKENGQFARTRSQYSDKYARGVLADWLLLPDSLKGKKGPFNKIWGVHEQFKEWNYIPTNQKELADYLDKNSVALSQWKSSDKFQADLDEKRRKYWRRELLKVLPDMALKFIEDVKSKRDAALWREYFKQIGYDVPQLLEVMSRNEMSADQLKKQIDDLLVDIEGVSGISDE